MGFGRGLFRRREQTDRHTIFGGWAVDIARAVPWVVSAEFDAAAFELAVVFDDGGTSRLGLITPFRRAANADGDEAVEILTGFLHNMLVTEHTREDPSGWAAVAPLLRPVLRPAGDLSGRVEDLRIGDHLLWRPILPQLTERVFIDHPTTMQSVTHSHLTEWGVDAETVFTTARTNMTDLAVEAVSIFDVADGVLFLPDDEGDLYSGSLPLVPGWLAGLGTKAGAQPIFFVPGAAGLLAGVASSPERVCELVRAAREMYAEAPRPVSPMPYTIDADNRLVPFTVPDGHPAREAIRSAESALTAAVYGGQYDSLAADHDAGLFEEFVAEALHVRGPDGIESTVATWTDTVPTLLPRTHAVNLVDLTTHTVVRVPWEALAAEVPLRPVPGLFPPRFRVEHHPDGAVLARMTAHAHGSTDGRR